MTKREQERAAKIEARRQALDLARTALAEIEIKLPRSRRDVIQLGKERSRLQHIYDLAERACKRDEKYELARAQRVMGAALKKGLAALRGMDTPDFYL